MANASRDLAVNLVGKTDKLNQSFSRLGGSLKGKAKAGLAALGVAAAAAITNAFMDAMAAEDTGARLQASLGLTDAQAAAAGETAANLYRDAWGGSLDEVSAAVAAMMSSFEGLEGTELETLTAQAIAFSNVFGTDVSEAVTAAGVLLKSGLVDDAQEAFDLLTVGMQKMPVGLRGELLEATQEYSQFFNALGIDGEEAFGLLVRASEDGKFGVDKMGDALKELTIRSTDMSKASVDAYEAAGLSAEDMSNRFLAGGETANKAFDDLVKGLLSIEDPTERANAAIGLFGTPIEDLGTSEIPAFLESLASMEDSLGGVEGAAQGVADTVGGTTSAKLTAFRRKVMGKLADAAAVVIAKFEEWGPTIRSVVGKVAPILAGLAKVAFAPMILAFKVIGKAIERFSGLWATHGEKIMAALKPVTDFVIKTFARFEAAFFHLNKLISALIDGDWAEAWSRFKKILIVVGRQIMDTIRTFGPLLQKGLKALGKVALKGLKNLGKLLLDQIEKIPGALGDLGGLLEDKGKDLLAGLRDGALNLWTDTVLPFIKSLPSLALAGIGALGKTLLQKGKDLLAGLRDGAVGVWGNFKTWLGDRGTEALVAVPSLLKTLGSRGKQLLNGLRNGAEGVWDGFKDWLGDRATEALLAVPGMLGTLRSRGKQLLNGLRIGATSVWTGAIRPWLGDLATNALLAVPSMLGTLKSRGKQLLNGLRNGAEEVWDGFKRWVGSLPTNIAMAVPDLSGALISAGRAVVGGLINGIGQRAADVVNAILNLIPGPIRSAVSGLLGLGGSLFGGGGSSGSGLPIPTIEGLAGGGHSPIKVHGGGRVVPGSPNDELLALLQGGETVRTGRQERELAAMMAGRGGGGGTFNVTINMPPGSDGDDVVRALRGYQRRRGPIPIKVRSA